MITITIIMVRSTEVITQRQYWGKKIYTRTLATTGGTPATQCPPNFPPLQVINSNGKFK